MTTIGKFTKEENQFRGHIETLTWSTYATFVPVTEKGSKDAPDYHIIARRCEIGAAWSKTSQAGKTYLSVKIDDPSFPTPLKCSLVESTDFHDLIWQR